MKHTVFAIVKANGELHRRRGGKGNLSVYMSQSTAQNHARDAGDSVVPVEISLEHPPVFIRASKVAVDGNA